MIGNDTVSVALVKRYKVMDDLKYLIVYDGMELFDIPDMDYWIDNWWGCKWTGYGHQCRIKKPAYDGDFEFNFHYIPATELGTIFYMLLSGSEKENPLVFEIRLYASNVAVAKLIECTVWYFDALDDRMIKGCFRKIMPIVVG